MNNMETGKDQPISKIQRIIATVFLLIGLVFLSVGAVQYFVPAIPEEFVGTTTATITNIVLRYNRSASNRRSNSGGITDVFIEYEAEGETYEILLGYYSSDMYVGQSMDIEYDIREPGRVSAPGGRTIGILIFLGLGVVFTVVGIVLQFKYVPVYVNYRRVA